MRFFLSRHLFVTGILASAALIASSCGDDKDDEPDPEVTYGTIVTADAKDANGAAVADANGSFKLTAVQTCSLNTDSALFEAKLVKSKSVLQVKIRNFNPAGATSACKPNADTSLLFENCMVHIEIANPTDSATYDAYSMSTDSTKITSAVPYTGACSIAYTYEKPKVEATITCTDMIQTFLKSDNVNPLNANATIDLTGESKFYCNIN